jgi:ABC-type multidrug transport system fused ATPase/permease subunit
MTAATPEPRKPRLERLREVLPLVRDLLRPRVPALLGGLAIILVARSTGLVLPAMAKVFVDDVVTANRPGSMTLVATAVLGAALVQTVCAFFLFRLLTVRTLEFVADLRSRGIDHLIRLAVPFFDKNQSGALLPRVLHDIESLRILVGSGFIEFMGSLIFALLSVGYMWLLSPRLTLVTVAALVSFAALLGNAFWGHGSVHEDRARLLSATSGRLSETLQGIRVIKAYRAEERESAALAASVAAMRDNAIVMARNTRTYTLWSTAILALSGLALMAMARSELAAGRVTLGGVTTFVILLGYLNGPIYMVVALAGQFADAFVAVERLHGILSEPIEATSLTTVVSMPLDPGTVEGHIVFEDVDFEYRPGEPVLRGVSFDAPPGTATALVGPSGAGKSTIMGLLAAFYRPQRGCITLDGRDIATLRLSDYRAHFGVVFQDTFLFDASLRDNILFARPDASEEEFRKACRSAHVDEFASRFEKGYDTEVGERGVRLSGGQKQRVSIARAFLANPRILLLDEATSNLDSESEAFIQKGLDELLPGRTTFVIAHRLSTIRRCQQILVLDRGEVIERGSDEDLRARSGRYAVMLQQQAGGWAPPESVNAAP